MKMRMFLIFVLAAFLAPAVQAIVLDNMDNVLASNGGLWHDERNYNPPLLKQNTDVAFVCDTTGSMMIDYTVFDGGQYDVVPRANIIFPTLTPDMAITFCWYKGNTAGPEHVREIILYSNNLGDAVARYAVANGEETIAVGWQYVVANISDFVVTQGTFDWSDVDTIDIWVSCWGYVGPWGEEGSYQIMPTNTPVYIDCLQLVPEPATMSLLALGALAMLKKRKA
ncbi:MAG: PEP-CTERM sorting domain-containing protein [Planctomycetaceae bacterium]|nr:PEP-CTERM sorting domain-containing protein [Planctomycetaceae bacterium]